MNSVQPTGRPASSGLRRASGVALGFALALSVGGAPEATAAAPPSASRGSIWQALGVGAKFGGAVCMPLGAGLRTLPNGVQRVRFASDYGLLGGVVARWRFAPEIALQLEAVGTSRRFRRTYSYPIRQRTETMTVQQVCAEFPLLIQYHRNIFYAEAGVLTSLAVRSTFEVRVNGPTQQETLAGPLPDAQRNGSAAVLGLGIEIPEGIWLGIRYQHGLRALSPEAPATEPVGPEGASNNYRLNGDRLTPVTFQLSAGYVLHPFGQPNNKPLAYRKKKSGKKKR